MNIEFRAVLKVRQRYCKWFESLMVQTLKQSKLFIMEETDQQSESSQKQLYSQEQDIMRAEPELICTTSHKPNLRERQPIAQKKEEAELKPQIEMIKSEDSLIDNPQKLLKCVLCHLNGERKISGRLLPF